MILFILYQLLLFAFLPIAMYKLYWPKAGKPNVGKRWVEHFGFGKKVSNVDLWFHAVSVGEVIAATPLIKQLKQQHPALHILVTTTTATGAEQVSAKLGELITHRYAPFDLWPCIKLFIHKNQPKKLWVMETELWPNWLSVCQQHRIPVSLVNARMSERSCKRYLRFSGFSQRLFAKLSLVLAQHQDDAQRFNQLGVAAANLQVSGSIKYDLPATDSLIQQAADTRKSLFAERLVWIAASTHKGEDELVLDVMQQVRKQLPDSLLILVPRHPERFDQVAELIAARELSFARRSLQQVPNSNQTVYLADTMGEMMLMYGCADTAFIGGSLVKIGGHNYLEAAAMCLPCVAGEYDFNFSDISQQLQACGALKLSADNEQLANWIKAWLSDENARKKAGEAGLGIVKQNQGALARSLDALLNH
ncbi:lipid IV(A) 3-deoxy-D-manno-octulosonic acid transferase [Agarivorans sp. 1_MG-2023]|uniref:lipid IV(A) 3-deoxy-D-manno-octulosonic acid transferase n=1 Tax=Agarivorans sp. 1_MG-2023 TaxID=3062634 RepID=UPI0026E2EA2B|nr:lipid IV(A) 3-deoxy-D-manno-octulosonic acid transferase [Agarivorans sp. 1_MG-2023]MDO6764327.1 lipid IV(A) 3-deoxy-D-manno-octulosonic acid transferase [Agarivorans sp. 1_MG-2023]